MCLAQKSASQLSSVRNRALPMWVAMVKQRKGNLSGKNSGRCLAMVTPLQLLHAHEVKRRLVDFSFVSAYAAYGEKLGNALSPPWCELEGFSSPVLSAFPARPIWVLSFGQQTLKHAQTIPRVRLPASSWVLYLYPSKRVRAGLGLADNSF